MGNVLLIFVEKFKFCRNNRRKLGCPKGSVKGQGSGKGGKKHGVREGQITKVFS